eukprot:537858-Lingulodinium_polyedra.AAC.1
MHVLSADLSGPHVESYGAKFKFFLVAVYKAGPGAKNLPFVRGISAKCAEETEKALNSIIAE